MVTVSVMIKSSDPVEGSCYRDRQLVDDLERAGGRYYAEDRCWKLTGDQWKAVRETLPEAGMERLDIRGAPPEMRSKSKRAPKAKAEPAPSPEPKTPKYEPSARPGVLNRFRNLNAKYGRIAGYLSEKARIAANLSAKPKPRRSRSRARVGLKSKATGVPRIKIVSR